MDTENDIIGMATNNETIGTATHNEIIGWIIVTIILLYFFVKIATSEGSLIPSIKIKRSARKTAFRRSDGKTPFQRKVKRIKGRGQYRV